MSNAKKCDRCGKFYDRYEGVKSNSGLRYFKLQLIGDNAPIIDLCENCMKSFFDWLYGTCEPREIEAGSEQARWRDGE